MQDGAIADLVSRVSGTAGLTEADAVRVIDEVLDHLSESLPAFVSRRHRELRGRGLKNDDIWPRVRSEINKRRFPAPELSERQLRRLVYG